MHGEYKTQGGKLVQVDFDVFDDHLANAVVSGDFFLYPEEALNEITDSLQGMPVTFDEISIANRVRDAIPEGVEWLGSSPEALAIAVRRALSSQSEANE